MVGSIASVQLTGGAGFLFEDKVAAYFLASMLSRNHPYGTDLGTISAVSWQGRGRGWLLDDLVITFQRQGQRTLALSIKSDRQVTGAGFPESFVGAARSQFTGIEPSAPFQRDRDLLGLAVGKLAGGVREAWHTLLRDARLGDSAQIADRYTAPRQSHAVGRQLLLSLDQGVVTPTAETIEFVRHIRLLHFDFADTGSQSEAFALWACQLALRSGEAVEAGTLWLRLVGLASERRGAGGSLDLQALVTALRDSFDLRDRIDNAVEWAVLDQRSVEYASQVKGSIGGRVSLVRRAIFGDLSARVADGQCILVAGNGGTGKSELVRRLADDKRCFRRYLWLNAASLDFDSLGEVERHIGVGTSLLQLLTTCATSSSCLVLDGLEVFSPRAMARAIAILEAVAPNPAARGWTILATTRPHSVEQARASFHQAGIDPGFVSTRYVDSPTGAECAIVIATSPGLNAALVGRELRASVRNLKLLDWIVTDGDQFPEHEIRKWIGISQVVDSLWSRWVGSGGDAAARAGVMKRLGRLEGEGLRHGIGTSDLDAAEHAVLTELESRELLSIREERIWFRHEMLGDWARLRVLVEQATGGGVIADFARFPRWHDAIRLYGQRLLETDSAAPTRWLQAVNSLAPDSPPAIVARDMLLEGLFCSVHARTLVERAWSALRDRNGTLLRRLLNRFLYAATIPDPRLPAIALTPSDEAELAPHLRFPWWPLWPDTLAVLAEHADDVAKLVPIEAAELCALWLRCMPVDARGSREACVLAIAIGREVQAARGEGLRFHHNHEDKTVFEAVLLAAMALPDDVSALCLELSRRRPDPPQITARANAHSERVQREFAERLARNPVPKHSGLGSTSLMFSRGPLRAQFPDGPTKRVDDGLKRAIFETQGLLTLATTRPEVAREVLLACSLEPPQHEREDDLGGMLDNLGIDDAPGSYPPMFHRGPWLPLLRQNPKLGVECVTRLVNQATCVWDSHFVPTDASPLARAATRVNVAIDTGRVECIGDMRVYGWYRDEFCRSHLLASALMALERYLYERIDQGLPVDDIVQQILNSARSVSLLAVLVAVGMYQPKLFLGPLISLLSVWQLYEWDLHLILNGDTWRIGFFQWAQSGERVYNLVRDWHTMPHRKQLFRDCAVFLMLSQTGAVDVFAMIRSQWQTELSSGSCSAPESLELLLARFNPDNYKRKTRDDGYVEVLLEWPEPLKTKTDRRLQESSKGSCLIALPFECRRLIDAGAPLDDEKAEAIWMQLREIASLPASAPQDEFDVDRRPDAMVAGLAVLRCLAPAWLSANKEREEWCDAQLDQVLEHPPQRTFLDCEQSLSTTQWHSFLADIAVVALADAPDDPCARVFAANAVTSFWYATTGVTLKAAHRHRERLGDDFNRLVNLAVLWTALRRIRILHDPTETEHERMLTRHQRLLSAFVQRRIPASMMNWPDIADVATRARDRIHRKHFPEYARSFGLSAPTGRDRKRRRSSSRERVQRSDPGFDIEALRYAFAWLSPPTLTPPTERHANRAWLRELLGLTLRMLPSEWAEDEEVEGTPYGYDSWGFDVAATFIAQMHPSDRPEEFWRPILQLGPAAHYWVESFLGAWTVSALKAAPSVNQFFDRWREMIQFAITSPVWMPASSVRNFRLRELWEHLLGMHLGASIVAADGHQSEFASLIPLYREWADAFLDEDRSLRAFLHLLGQDGARPLLCPAIPWLLRAAQHVNSFEWARDPIADELASVLRLAWTWHADTIATSHDLQLSFVALLNLLVTQQSRVAMDLRERVSRTVATASGMP